MITVIPFLFIGYIQEYRNACNVSFTTTTKLIRRTYEDWFVSVTSLQQNTNLILKLENLYTFKYY